MDIPIYPHVSAEELEEVKKRGMHFPVTPPCVPTGERPITSPWNSHTCSSVGRSGKVETVLPTEKTKIENGIVLREVIVLQHRPTAERDVGIYHEWIVNHNADEAGNAETAR